MVPTSSDRAPSLSAPKVRSPLRFAALGVWIAYLVIPVAGWGLFEGRPLGLLSTTVLAAVCWTAFVSRKCGLAGTIALALALKIVAGMTLLLPRGFEARYAARSSAPRPSRCRSRQV